MQRHVQTELAKRFIGYLKDGVTHYAEGRMEIPVSVYHDAHHAELERDVVFRRQPILVGRSGELREPGEFITTEVVGASVVVVRQEDGSLKAFANVCRHRCGKVVLERHGCSKRFKCDYHGWTYNHDGSLRSIPFPEGFDGVDRAGLGLIELPVDERHGMVWVVLTPGGSLDIRALIGEEMDRELASFGLEDYQLVREATFDEPMNWKIVADGFLDPYHLIFVHPKTVGPFFNTNVYTLDVLTPHAARLVVSRRSMRTIVDQDPETVDLLPHVICNYMVLPNTFITVEPEHFEVWTICPHPADPARSITTLRFLMRTPPQNEREQSYFEKNWNLLLHTVTQEDWAVGRDLQRGIAQAPVQRSIIGRNEAPIQFVHGNLLGWIDGKDSGSMAPADAPYPRTYGNLVADAAP